MKYGLLYASVGPVTNKVQVEDQHPALSLDLQIPHPEAPNPQEFAGKIVVGVRLGSAFFLRPQGQNTAMSVSSLYIFIVLGSDDW